MNSNGDNRETEGYFFNYKPKLLGILPQHYVFSKPTRWDTTELLVCRPPSQQDWLSGPLLKQDHPHLVGTAVVEKKLWGGPGGSDREGDEGRSPASKNNNEKNDEEREHPKLLSESEAELLSALNLNREPETLPVKPKTHLRQYQTETKVQQNTNANTAVSVTSGKYISNVDADDHDQDSSGSTAAEPEQMVRNIWNTGSSSMKFLKNTFHSELDTLPDFTCNRNVLVNLMTESKEFVIQATKHEFSSRLDTSKKQFSTIELYFRPLSFENYNARASRIVNAILSKQQVLPYDVSPSVSLSQRSSESDTEMNWRTSNSSQPGSNNSSANYQQPSTPRQPWTSTSTAPRSRSRGEYSPRYEEQSRSPPTTDRDRDRNHDPTSWSHQRQSWNSLSDGNVTEPHPNLSLDTETDLDLEHEEESEAEDISYCAYVQGKLTRVNQNRQELSKTLTFNMGLFVDGVWTNKNNPYNYTCADLAEVKTAKSSTVNDTERGQHFYQKVRMSQNWGQTYLAGLKQYMVGVTVPLDVGNKERAIKELLLYSVDKVPQAVVTASKQNDFTPWTPEELQSKLFSFLLDIKTSMSNTANGVPMHFFHYDSEAFLVPMTYGEVQDEIRCLQEARKKVSIKGLIPPPPLANEERQNAYIDMQIQTILNYIGWPGQFGKPVVKRVHREVIVTFGSELEANVFFRLVKSKWRVKMNIPHGFERLWVEMKPPLTRIHENALQLSKQNKQSFEHGFGSDGTPSVHRSSSPRSGSASNSKASNRFYNQKTASWRVPQGLYPHPRSLLKPNTPSPSPP